MTKNIEEIIRDMNGEEIARIRGGFTDPYFEKGAEIEYCDVEYRVIDFGGWSSGDLCYLVRPLDEPGVVTRLPQDIIDMVAEEVGD
ncbi:hypothetical protein [Natrialba swarupiae]|uniref:Uncharacterized protein n=1 Tax=Natrialba swarupiae TaxID=2448032 RepID=A0A5D5AIV9_9EURY|nr:hypothetical protein [Natrialba swarupiae]TYT60863.1 hypothetical protein FYC77_16685 [Natrialba swarupiae]